MIPLIESPADFLGVRTERQLLVFHIRLYKSDPGAPPIITSGASACCEVPAGLAHPARKHPLVIVLRIHERAQNDLFQVAQARRLAGFSPEIGRASCRERV